MNLGPHSFSNATSHHHISRKDNEEKVMFIVILEVKI